MTSLVEPLDTLAFQVDSIATSGFSEFSLSISDGHGQILPTKLVAWWRFMSPRASATFATEAIVRTRSTTRP